MKKVTPNVTDVLTTRYIASLARLRKFKRYWGTTVVDGEEVFVNKKYLYPNMDEATIKLTKFLKMYNSIKQDYQGVDSVWLTLSADKASDSIVDWDKTVLVSNFNVALTKTLSCSLIIGPRLGKDNKLIPADITTPVSNQAGLLTEIKTKYKTLWDAGYSFFSSESDPYLAILSMYVLRSTDIPYTVSIIEETVASAYLPSSKNMDGIVNTDQVKAWRVRLVIPNFTFLETTDIINFMSIELSSDKTTAGLLIKERITTASQNGSVEGATDNVYEGLAVSISSFWLTKTVTGGRVPVTTRYLKTSILDTPSLNLEQKFAYITGALDSGYRKTPLKWYEKLIVVIIIIVAAYLAGPAGGAAGAAVGGAMGGAIAAVVVVAVTITVAALYIALAALAASYLGAQNVASSLGQFLKSVAPLVQVASIISVIASVYSVIRKGIEQAAQEAIREGAQASLGDIAKGIVVNMLDAVTGLTKLSNMTMAHVAKMLSFTFNIYKDMQMRDMQREINNYRREIASIAEAYEKSQTSDVVKELMHSYPNPLASDWSYYSELYDRPYEWWATPYHTGNIQATTVNALWLNEPQNAILYNNFTGDS
jgi:hypothetical protein